MKLIAETAWHHQGEFGFMKRLSKAIVNRSRADIVKFHLTMDRDEYMQSDHPLYKNIGKWMLKKGQWEEIINLTLLGGKELMLLFNDSLAVEFGMAFKPSYVEIHSVCLNDIRLIESLNSNLDGNTKVVLGVGGTSLHEIENAINMIQTENIVLTFGFQNYPTKYQDINFKKMRRVMKLFGNCQFGYADHTAWNEPNNILITLLGAAVGMDYVEKHVTIAYGEERIDWNSAVSIEMFNKIKEGLDVLTACEGNGLLWLNRAEQDYSVFGTQKKACLLKVNVNAGDTLTKEKITFKRTGQISDLTQIEALENIGGTINRDLKKGQVLMRAYLEKTKGEEANESRLSDHSQAQIKPT